MLHRRRISKYSNFEGIQSVGLKIGENIIQGWEVKYILHNMLILYENYLKWILKGYCNNLVL